MKLAESILELFYPSTCPGCGNHTSLKNGIKKMKLTENVWQQIKTD